MVREGVKIEDVQTKGNRDLVGAQCRSACGKVCIACWPARPKRTGKVEL